MVWAAAIPAAAVVISALLGKKGQDDTNEANANLNAENRQFQQEMSSTSYQRAVADMSAAGLNPMLAYSQGGASTPGGSVATMQNSMGAGIASGSQAASTISALQDTRLKSANIDMTQAQTEKIKSETMDQRLNTALLINQVEREKQSGSNLESTARKAWFEGSTAREHYYAMSKRDDDPTTDHRVGEGFSADVRRRRAEASREEAEARIRHFGIPGAKRDAEFNESTAGHANPYIRQILEILGGAVNAGRQLTPRR